MPSLPELECTNKRLAVHPSGRFAYLLTNAEVFTFAVAADGKLGSPSRFEHYLFRAPNSFAIDRTGRFLFVGNGAAGMQVFSLDTATGTPTFFANAPDSTSGIYDIVGVAPD
jgi:6-phosphogluconolactonase (cycloisomerase 2 family)